MSEILQSEPSPGVVLLQLNRPEQLNALSMSVRDLLAAHLRPLAEDDVTRCIVITGNERAFAAGADISELAQRSVLDPAFRKSRAAWLALDACPKPVIAAISGFALGGGCELAMHCDVIVAGESAKLGLPEVKLGLMPGAGGTQRLVRAVGKFAAMRWLLTGDMITAADALRAGLVSEVVPDAEVLERALALAARISMLPPLAVAAIKESVLFGPDASLTTALALERKTFQLLFASEDRSEGIQAFQQRRKPQFKGR